MLQGIVLDFDGAVVNSEPLHLRAFQEVLAEGGHTLSAQEYDQSYAGLDDAAMFAAFAQDRGRAAPAHWVRQVIEAKTVRMQALLGDGSPLFPGAAERIRELSAAAPLAIASGALRHEILMVLDRAGLTRASARLWPPARPRAANRHPTPMNALSSCSERHRASRSILAGWWP